MGRYRKQMLTLMMAKKELDTKPVLTLHEDHAKVCLMFQLKKIVTSQLFLNLDLDIVDLMLISAGGTKPGGEDMRDGTGDETGCASG